MDGGGEYRGSQLPFAELRSGPVDKAANWKLCSAAASATNLMWDLGHVTSCFSASFPPQPVLVLSAKIASS